MTSLVWDYDYIKWNIASVTEKRSIVVTHKQSGNVWEFDNRTAFYGHYAKKAGGWLAMQNEKRDIPWLPEEFLIEDKQVAQPVEFALALVKNHIEGIVDKLGADSYRGFIGRGASWRLGRSTILEYKGNRKELIKPLHLAAIEDYLLKHHNAEEVYNLEADDRCVMEATNDSSKILVGVDKDYCGCQVKLYNPDHGTEPLNIHGYGKLWEDDKGKVRGIGRAFLYFQTLSGDSSDNYFANAASDIKWGDKNTYKLLKDCTTDKEALQALVQGYKKLYPEQKVIKGWRGDDLTIDWLYVASECFDLARMIRWENDVIVLKDVLDKLGVDYV